jgi:hypothetical protein
VLDELIAFGWIDGLRRKLEDARTMQLISPRRQQAWAQTYEDRAARLEAEGRMHLAGLTAIAVAKAAGGGPRRPRLTRWKCPMIWRRPLGSMGMPSTHSPQAIAATSCAGCTAPIGPRRAPQRLARIVDSTKRGERLPQPGHVAQIG